jgi:DNA-directed RNA polymerase subunit RPC12/RpoP
MKKTGKYSIKPYECLRCGHEFETGTNHWGNIYNIKCTGCSWKYGPGHSESPFVECKCNEEMPEGFEKPEPWKTVKLGDLIK